LIKTVIYKISLLKIQTKMVPKAMENREKLTIFKNSFSTASNQLAMGIMSIIGQDNTAKRLQGKQHQQEPNGYLNHKPIAHHLLPMSLESPTSDNNA
jgi:hypothetical protein